MPVVSRLARGVGGERASRAAVDRVERGRRVVCAQDMHSFLPGRRVQAGLKKDVALDGRTLDAAEVLVVVPAIGAIGVGELDDGNAVVGSDDKGLRQGQRVVDGRRPRLGSRR